MILRYYITLILTFGFQGVSADDDSKIFPSVVESYDQNIPTNVLFEAIESQPFDGAASSLIYLHELTVGRTTELTWWKSRSSNLRKLALFLMFNSISDAVVGDALNSDLSAAATRFSESEKVARVDEIKWVLGHFSRLSDEWKKLEAP